MSNNKPSHRQKREWTKKAIHSAQMQWDMFKSALFRKQNAQALKLKQPEAVAKQEALAKMTNWQRNRFGIEQKRPLRDIPLHIVESYLTLERPTK